MAKSTRDYAAEFARKGGKARAKELTKQRRQEIARKGGLAKAKKTKKGTARHGS